MDTLWPDLDSRAAANNLHYALHVARGALCGTNSTWWNEPLMLGVTQPEVRWMYNDLLVPMNREIMPAAAGRHGWTFVGGVMNPFGILDQPPGYGYCANDTWVRRSSESVEMQGPNNRLETKGLLHPNARGHEVYRQRIFAAITGASALEGPTYTTPELRPPFPAGLHDPYRLRPDSSTSAVGVKHSGNASPPPVPRPMLVLPAVYSNEW